MESRDPQQSSEQGCLDDMDIAELLDGTMPDERRRLAVAHLIACDECRERLSALALVLDDPTVASAGFPFQVPLSTWRLRLGPELQAADGQTLDYPWVGFVEAIHAVPFVGLDGAVWEASGGPQIPVYARNVQSVRQRLASVTPSAIVARLRELQERASLMLGEIEQNLGPGQEAMPFPLLLGVASPSGIAMIRDVARRGHQIGTKDDIDLIRERASNAFDMLRLERRCQHHHDAIAYPRRDAHDR